MLHDRELKPISYYFRTFPFFQTKDVCAHLFLLICANPTHRLISVLCNSKTKESIVWAPGTTLLVPDEWYRPLCSHYAAWRTGCHTFEQLLF